MSERPRPILTPEQVVIKTLFDSRMDLARQRQKILTEEGIHSSKLPGVLEAIKEANSEILEAVGIAPGSGGFIKKLPKT